MTHFKEDIIIHVILSATNPENFLTFTKYAKASQHVTKKDKHNIAPFKKHFSSKILIFYKQVNIMLLKC